MSNSFQINPDFEPLFKANGLTSFDALMHGAVGEMVSCPRDRRKLYRFTIADGEGPPRCFYLKRMSGEPFIWLLKALFLAHRPHCGPIRELHMLSALDRAGFAVMQPVAWGESRRTGMPICGFLVVSEVRGRDVADLAVTLPVREQLALLREVGNLVGRLHARGFFQPVRLKDLIREESQGRLVMIDRETSKPWTTRFTKKRAIEALTRTARRTLRDGHRFGPASLRSILSGYAQGVSERWPVSVIDLRRPLLARLRKDLA